MKKYGLKMWVVQLWGGKIFMYFFRKIGISKCLKGQNCEEMKCCIVNLIYGLIIRIVVRSINQKLLNDINID